MITFEETEEYDLFRIPDSDTDRNYVYIKIPLLTDPYDNQRFYNAVNTFTEIETFIADHVEVQSADPITVSEAIINLNPESIGDGEGLDYLDVYEQF